ADAANVTGERGAALGVPENDVMRSVPRRKEHLQRSAGQRNRLAIREHIDLAFGDRSDLTPERIHAIAVDPAGAGQEFSGIHEMDRAEWMNVHCERRISP